MSLRTDDFRARARRYLPRFVFDYVDGGAEDERCLRRNRDDLDALRLVPNCLRDTSTIDTAVEVFGRRWAHPVGVAPVGFNGLVRPQGDVLLARAAAAQGLPFVLSTASNARLEAVRAAAPEAVLWMQLYVMGERAIAEQIVRRAKAARFEALVLTVDVPVSGLRERDVRNGFRLPFRPGPRMLWDLASHPAWSLGMARQGAPGFVNLSEHADGAASAQVQAALLARAMDRSLVWDSLAWLRGLWSGPLLLKGVLHHGDARRALQAGVDGLIVSNHGGRQLDAAPSSISVLGGILDAVEGRVPVFADSGFRRGSDVLKAVALGARGVFLGRHAVWGLAAGGEAGAREALALIGSEIERTMTLMGAASLRELGRGQLAPAFAEAFTARFTAR
ncbi:MAG: alpha-hydroxy-acid oxidizing protein [Hydrogenophaga sp.]|uniref:alpha-hydroxy acid oxidase n=1 Tax=Hydrogenophaga sp. TaxID=1904254 RepID=UPI00257C3242|nr:alpha-hydroxy acid oxidase [Hydrogenophaga sp.]MBL0944493.1 alpha-hydroxy-acid oxidizing protein [Hydrogenophaga sp.]